jgi:hypothetical protein
MIKSRNMRWEGHVTHIGKKRNRHHALLGKPEGKGQFRRLRRRWEDIKVNLKEMGREAVKLIHLAQNRDQ